MFALPFFCRINTYCDRNLKKSIHLYAELTRLRYNPIAFLSTKMMDSGYIVSLTIFAGLYAVFALGLNVQWGIAGLINFGHVAFMTIGAYTTALLTLGFVIPDTFNFFGSKINIAFIPDISPLPIVVAVPIGMGLAALLGLAIGFSTLRLREDYLAIVTIGVSELIRLVANNEEWLTKGPSGVQRYPLPLEDLDSVSQQIVLVIFTLLAVFVGWQLWQTIGRQWRESQQIVGKSYKPTKPISLIIWGTIAAALTLIVYVNGVIEILDNNYKIGLMMVVLIVLAVVYAVLEFLGRSPWGRVLKAIREDEEIARALGKNIFWYKLQAFMLGGAIAGIAGSFLAWQLTTIYPTRFEPLLTFDAWIIVVLGGAGSNAGTILGAIIYWAYDTLTRFLLPSIGMTNESQSGALRVMIIGLILMILMRWRPQGLLGKKEELTLSK